MPDLVLGPVLRYVDDRRATVWVQTDEPCAVEVLGHRARTFTVEGHHFALVAVDGLEPGSAVPYEVALDGRPVWPPAGDRFPPSVIRTVAPGADLRIAFGSCREVVPHEPPYTCEEDEDRHGHGLDALRALALELADDGGDVAWPDVLLMLGDQLYADEPPRHLAGVLHDREARPDRQPQATTFADYAVLYRASWCEPAVRWLLSTVPSAMIFDDHELVDEWMISQAWVDDHRGDERHERRVEAGLGAYWVFQHLGNLSPDELAADRLFARVHDLDDAGPLVRRLAREAGAHVEHSRWSFARRLGRTNLVVLDSRATRRLTPGARRIIDDREWDWAQEQVRAAGEGEHVVIASSLPPLLPRGLHELEAAIERLGDGAWGARAARATERFRRAFNLGHWASFQASFRRLAALLDELAGRPAGGGRPASIVLLSGDLHHGYLARMRRPAGGAPVWQVVCSPFRKRLARHERAAMRLGNSRATAIAGRMLRHATGVPRSPIDWDVVTEPSYRNQTATLELAGRFATVRLRTPEGDWRRPQLRTVWARRLA